MAINSLFPDPSDLPSGDGGLIANILAQYAAAPPDTSAPLSPIEAQMMGMTGPNQPVSGLGPAYATPPAPAQQPAAAPQPAQPQNAPIAVGNVMMPRIGAGFTPPAIDPQTGETVQPTAPAQPAPSQPQQPQQAAPAAPSFLDATRSHLDASDQSLRHGGGLIGGLTALVTGQRHDPVALAQADQAARQQTQVKQLATALTGAGIPQQQALQLATIHTIDPESGRALIAKALGPPQAAPQYAWDPTTKKAVKTYDTDAKDNFVTVQTGEDAQGAKTFSKMNKATGEMTPIAGAPGADNGGGIGDTTKTGEEYLNSLPPKIRGTVKALAEYRQAPPTGFAAAKPYYAKTIMPAVQQYDPTYDATQYGARAAGAKDFTSGKSSEMVRSANQTLQHVNALLDSADALHNGNYPTLNYVGNKANEMTGGGEPGAFITNAHAVADEMGKVFKGSNLSDSEIKAWADNLSPNMSPAQQRAQIGKMTELLHGALDALDEKRVASIGQGASDKAGPIIKPEGQKVLQRIDQWLKSNGTASGAAASGTAPTGVKWSVVQ
jgi:hypothetical protein